MFSNWFYEYENLTGEMRFFSKLASFLISLLAVFSLYGIAELIDLQNYSFNEIMEIHMLFNAIVFHILIATVFATRFIFLFFSTKKAFIFNQSLWLAGVLLLFTYWRASIPETLSFGIYSTYTSIFQHAARSFDSIGVMYLIFSPFIHLTIFIVGIIKSK